MRKIKHKSAPAVFGIVLALSAGIAGRMALRLPWWTADRINLHADEAQALSAAGATGLAWVMTFFFAVGCLFLLVCSFLAVVKRRWVPGLLRKAFISAYLLFWLYVYALFRISAAFLANDIPFYGEELDTVTLFYVRWDFIKWPLCWMLVLLGCHIASWCRRVINLYTGENEQQPDRGDRLLENVRCGGEDPQFRKSWLSSVSTHLLVLVILPWLFQFIGCVEPYRVPKGSGDPVVALVQIVQPKEKPKKQYILRPDSAIYFRVPDLDESDVLKEVQEMTELTYQADPSAMAGRMGRGGGKTGGWPDGMEDSKVRFIRLEHGGAGWDDGMDSITRADLNFLEEFQRLTGFDIADRPESHPVRLLRRYPKGMAPPFVYITGTGDINIRGADLRILREYLNDGGMLIADCASPSFDRSFRRFAASLFSDQSLTVIADDDPLFQFPYAFPNGAPPLWHHGGTQAMGIKIKGRWAVFYHPGDMKDAWKTGHSGMRPELARGAFQMGVNIVYYAFSNYLEQTRKYRKGK